MRNEACILTEYDELLEVVGYVAFFVVSSAMWLTTIVCIRTRHPSPDLVISSYVRSSSIFLLSSFVTFIPYACYLIQDYVAQANGEGAMDDTEAFHTITHTLLCSNGLLNAIVYKSLQRIKGYHVSYVNNAEVRVVSSQSSVLTSGMASSTADGDMPLFRESSEEELPEQQLHTKQGSIPKVDGLSIPRTSSEISLFWVQAQSKLDDERNGQGNSYGVESELTIGRPRTPTVYAAPPASVDARKTAELETRNSELEDRVAELERKLQEVAAQRRD